PRRTVRDHAHPNFPAQPPHRRDKLPHQQRHFIGHYYGHTDPANLAAPADVALAIRHFDLIAKIVQDHLPPTSVRLGVFDHQLELAARPLLQICKKLWVEISILADLVDEKFLSVAILKAEQHDAAGELTVAAGAAR